MQQAGKSDFTDRILNQNEIFFNHSFASQLQSRDRNQLELTPSISKQPKT